MKKIDSTDFYLTERHFKRPLFDVNKKISLNIRGKIINIEGEIKLQIYFLTDDFILYSSIYYSK